MGKKMKFPFLHKSNSINNSSWPWPSCHTQPRTLSFRKTNDSADSYVTESAFTESTEPPSVPEEPETIDKVIEGLRSSQRLFFDPKGETNSILEEGNGTRQEGFTLLSMESKDPYFDFQKSMEEMIEAHGLRDWETLEHLLSCYLKVNGKTNHGYIFGAFVDLLLGFALADRDNSQNDSVSSERTTTMTTRLTYSSSSSCSCYYLRESPSSPLSFYASCSSSDESCSVPMETGENRDEDEVVENRAPSLLETEIKIEDLDDITGYVSC